MLIHIFGLFVLIFILATTSYNIFLVLYNDNLIHNMNCIDINNTFHMKKNNNDWSDMYTILNHIESYTLLKCPTTSPVIYNIINNYLVSYIKTTDSTIYNNLTFVDRMMIKNGLLIQSLVKLL